MAQDDDLGKTLCSVDIATQENLQNLVKVGENLLKKPVSQVNLDTGIHEPAHHSTNEEALARYLAIRFYSATMVRCFFIISSRNIIELNNRLCLTCINIVQGCWNFVQRKESP